MNVCVSNAYDVYKSSGDMCQCTCGKVRGQLHGVSSLHLLYVGSMD